MDSFSKNGAGSLIRIDSIMTAQKYNSIISETVIPFAEETMVSIWIFQHDNTPKNRR